MGKRSNKSLTMPPSPTHSHSFSSSSSSSSDFEFTISLSPHKTTTTLCPADELFYKGQLLPLHISPRLSMVRTLLTSSSTSSLSDTTTTASRDSSSSAASSDVVWASAAGDCDSYRPSSVNEDDEFRRLTKPTTKKSSITNKYFSLSRLFNKDGKQYGSTNHNGSSSFSSSSSSSSVKRVSQVFRKYIKKVMPLYGKLSQRQHHQQMQSTVSSSTLTVDSKLPHKPTSCRSFSGNLRCTRKRMSCALSCPSSMRSSPTHPAALGRGIRGEMSSSLSSMEELQSAIQGAIAHCKNSMNKGSSEV